MLNHLSSLGIQQAVSKHCLANFRERERERERAGCFALFVFLVSRECCVALPHDATGLSAVCDCGIS